MIFELERFLKLEIKARDTYEDILKKIKDNEIREALLHVRNEEIKHINLLKKAIKDIRT